MHFDSCGAFLEGSWIIFSAFTLTFLQGKLIPGAAERRNLENGYIHIYIYMCIYIYIYPVLLLKKHCLRRPEILNPKPGPKTHRKDGSWTVSKQVTLAPHDVLQGTPFKCKVRLCTKRCDVVLRGPTLHCKARFCTTRYDWVLQGTTLYYKVRLCTTRFDCLLVGTTLKYRVRLGTTSYYKFA